MQLIERFLQYVKMDTQSDPGFTQIPSTSKQKLLGELLVEQLLKMGVEDAHLDEYGIVYGTVKGNVDHGKTIGFIAHMDTSPDVSGANVKPRILKQYDGKDIVLNEELQIVTKTAVFPSLLRHIGKTLIVTDGTTLLGADDKAGIAEIMELVSYYHTHPEEKHATIKVAFTPDEEIGHGTDYFDVKKFGADYAYTLDGSEVEVVEFENFNAASCEVTIKGTNTHPGTAKHKMVNSIVLAMEFQSMLPVFDNPMYTEGYEGFNHLNEMEGSVEETKLHYIIRNHDKVRFAKQKEDFEAAAAFLNRRHPGTVTVAIQDSYANMRESMLDHMYIVENAMKAVEMAELTPRNVAIRGGTDGARLTYAGLPCPNLGTGGYQYHGRNEYACVEEMELAVEIMKNIIRLSVQE